MNGLVRRTVFVLLACTIVLLSSFALAQTKEGQLEAQQVPGTQAVPPNTRLHAVKGDPSNSLKLYSAAAQGLQVSENGGLSWQPLAVGGKHEEVLALAVHPSNPDTLFIGRRDGLWKSQDGGKSWDSLPYPGSVPLSVAIAKSQPDILYLATARRGVYKSINGGHQWMEISQGLPEARAGGRPEEIHTLAVNPLDSDVVYAALAGRGIYRTVDGGKSWHEFHQGLVFSLAQSVLPPKLAFDPEDPRYLYLAFNERIHSHLVEARLYTLSDSEEWLPVEVGLPSNFLTLDLVVDGTRQTIQLWGSEAVWEVPLLRKDGSSQ